MYEAYSLNDITTCTINYKRPFIIACEFVKKDGNIGRKYIALNSFNLFLQNRNKYPHSHEILVDHINYINSTSVDMIRSGGRLVFDFDIKYSDVLNIPNNIKIQIEEIINLVIDKYFIDIDGQKIQFVWSSCENPVKISKHLTVKNLYFNDWIIFSKFFYLKFIKIWDNKFNWIKGVDLIDQQIIKKSTSLRMVGSSKIGGNILLLDDDDKYTFQDSLIRIYRKPLMKIEQIINLNNVKEKYHDKYFSQNDKILHHNYFSPNKETQVDNIIYYKAFKCLDNYMPSVFKIGKTNDNIINLVRLKPHECLLSDKIHENENAFLVVENNLHHYNIYFGCYRHCGKDKLIKLGTIDNLTRPIFKQVEILL
ncbi:hypothetical protein QJ854_gp888 [Moumouvirus goulette]|uniref:Uncharacterized protein n=1 Tax=Moumouvirus goulette TaxID=1247379 RepID=M1PAL7_9VIRU|nr:hypothetical protein QJ854_gp888 [Moumouvirus goulette]AGF84894.1 hypothetical protein glt_00085 [Moumouvirus goulette]